MARTYVITGASSGVGAATTALLRAAGHTVVGLARSGTDVRADLSTTQGRADGAAAAVAAAGGHVDAVITCAAVSGPPRDSVSVNYFGTVDFLTALRPHLAHSPAPRAAAVSSMSVFQPSYPGLVDLLLAGDEPGARRLAEELTSNPATQTMIGSSGKRALSQWVRSEAITSSWAGAGIALNAVAPGVILTPRTNQLLTTPESIAFVDASVPMPLNYHQEPEAIAHLLIWLTSAENTHCCGQTFFCDGGADAVVRGPDIYSWADQRTGEYFANIADPRR